MNIKDFISGSYRQEYQYKSFVPSHINHTFVWDDPQINTMLEEANIALTKLNSFSLIFPNIEPQPHINAFIQMHIVKEANTSSKIEGTRTEIDEIIVDKDQVEPEKRDDWQEVHNYIDAINFAIQNLKTLPISNRLIRQTHKILLNSVRGSVKLPGEFRKSQNWIGGSNLTNAMFIPPHFELIDNLMSDLEKFLHNSEIYVPHLIKIAIIHYQFETIHPFLDGNGRIGRLLITLYLVANGLLNQPLLYISDYIEKHKGGYYEGLNIVRQQNNLAHWLKFFLEAVTISANSGINKLNKVLTLKQDMDDIALEFGKRAKLAAKLLNYLYQKPNIEISDIIKPLEISKQTAATLVKAFQNKGIIKEITGYNRNKRFIFTRYIEIYSQS